MKLVYTKPVLQRITEIEEYFTQHAAAEKAEALVGQLLAQARTLRDHPLRGAPEKRLKHRGTGHRSLIVGRYKIIYYIHEEEVRITDFFDMKQHRSRMRG